jgi:ribose transport system ATP-binding protein
LNIRNKIKDISFGIKKGEVFGIAGLIGSGRSEIVRAIFGIDRISSGEIFISGQKVTIRGPKDAIKLGLGFAPEDRKEQGVIVSMSIRENITMPILKRFLFFLGIIKNKKERSFTNSIMQKLSIKAKNTESIISELSGGNQQKVSIAKWLGADSEIYILDEPTRGIDVGAKFEVYQLIRQLASSGKCILLISSELNEIVGLCDRAMVIARGRLKGFLEGSELSEDRIMKLVVSKN